MFLHYRNYSVYHRMVLCSTFLDILLGVAFLEMSELDWCGDGVSFRKFQIKLLRVNKPLSTGDVSLNIRALLGR